MRVYYAANRQNEIRRARRSQKGNPERISAYKKMLDRKYPDRYLLRSARGRAKKEGCPFNLVAADIVIPTVCPFLGIPLRINDGRVGPDSPSLDRIDPTLGYVRGNVHVISHRANTIKSDASLEELQRIVAYLEILLKRIPQ
jgi:hypothetical protein